MKKFLQHFILSMFLFTLAACNKEDILQKIASPEEQAVAKKYLSLLKQQQFDEIEKVIDPSLKEPSLHDHLIRMAALLPVGEPSVTTLIGAQKKYLSDYSTINLTYEYGFSGKWLIANVAIKNQNDQMSIIGMSVTPQSASIEEQTKFSLTDKSATQYLILVLAIAFPIVTIIALIICIRMKLRGRKWPWVLFILTGFGNLAVNWNTGVWAYSIFALQMFSASASAAFYGPWIISISLPLGAICFLVFRKNHAAEIIEASS
jgi:archaellum biogenesis protein FlaJ (TadC family)